MYLVALQECKLSQPLWAQGAFLDANSRAIALIFGVTAGLCSSASAEQDEPEISVTFGVLEVRQSKDTTEFIAEGEVEAQVHDGLFNTSIDLEYLEDERAFDTFEIEAAYTHPLSHDLSGVLGVRLDASDGEALVSGVLGLKYQDASGLVIEGAVLLSTSSSLRAGIARDIVISDGWTWTPFIELEFPLSSEATQERFSHDELLEIGASTEIEIDDSAIGFEIVADVLADDPSITIEMIGVSRFAFLGEARLDIGAELTFEDRSSIFNEVIEIEIGGRIVLLEEEGGFQPYVGLRYIDDISSNEDAELYGVVGMILSF